MSEEILTTQISRSLVACAHIQMLIIDLKPYTLTSRLRSY